MNVYALNTKMKQRELSISESAADQAMSECPKTTDTELDIHQQNIVNHFTSSIDDLRNAALEKLNMLKEDRGNIENEIEDFSLKEINESANHKIIRLHAERHEILENAKKEEEAELRNYKFFLYQNGLNREASYPESSVLHWAIILVAILAESIVNSFFFAKASDLGLLGGLFQALFISISNIGSALLIGRYVLPYKNHIDQKKQFRAKIITVVYLIFIFIFNLGAAHYRTLLEADPSNAGTNIIPHLFQHPLSISFESLNLLIIGMLFMVVAILKGYKSDDVYPGFGEAHRRFKNASNHHGKRMEAMKSINSIIDDHSRHAAALVQNAKHKIKDYKNSILHSEDVITRFAKEVSTVENACNNALWEYRNANMRVRSTKPPAYFSQKHSFDNYLLNADFSEEKSTYERIESRFHSIQNKEEQKLNEALRRINEKALEDFTVNFEKTP